jgi:hypothetical protein
MPVSKSFPVLSPNNVQILFLAYFMQITELERHHLELEPNFPLQDLGPSAAFRMRHKFLGVSLWEQIPKSAFKDRFVELMDALIDLEYARTSIPWKGLSNEESTPVRYIIPSAAERAQKNLAKIHSRGFRQERYLLIGDHRIPLPAKKGSEID